MKENTVMLPCPFCGHDDLLGVENLETDGGWFVVKCRKCGAHGPVGVSGSDKEAVLQWNRRAEPITCEAGSMVQRKTWADMRRTGLLWWVNRILHTFGWAIVVVVDEAQAICDVYPARVKFRGFAVDAEMDGFKKLTRYMGEEYQHLLEDFKSHE